MGNFFEDLLGNEFFKGGERDEEGNLTEEGEYLIAPIWDEEHNKAWTESLEFDFSDERWTKFGSDNPLVTGGTPAFLADPGQFITSGEYESGEVSERSATAAIIAATFGYGAVGGGGAAAGEGAAAGGSAATAGTAASAGAGTAEGVVAAEQAAAGVEAAEVAEAGVAAEEGLTTLDVLSEVGQAGLDQEERVRQAENKKLLENLIARKKVQSNVGASNLAQGEQAEFSDALFDPGRALAGEQLTSGEFNPGETPTPIPIQPTPRGEPGPDSVTTVDGPNGRTTTYKSEGIPQQTDPYSTNESLESVSRPTGKRDFYNDLLGGQDGR